MDREYLLKKSKSFCMAPWVHMFLRPGGAVLPCCYFKWDAELGNLKEQTIEEIWDSEASKKLRRDMLEDRELPECLTCNDLQRAGHHHMRGDFNSRFGHHFARVEATAADGAAGRVGLAAIELRFSNLCNFRCRICHPELSSLWYDEGKELGLVHGDQARVLTPTDDPEDLRRQLEPLLPQLEQVSFGGGEPLISPEHYWLLDLLIAKKMFHVRLQYATNFSIMNREGVDVMSLWDMFEDVSVGASLDGMGARGEYMRKGQNWDETLRNRERMMKVCPRARFGILATLNVMNALHLPDLHADWMKRGFMGPDGMWINVLRKPEEYSVQVLPPHLKRLVAEKYERHLAALPGLSPEAQSHFRGSINYMMARDQSGLLMKFRERTLKLDEMRGERFADVFPELAELMIASASG